MDNNGSSKKITTFGLVTMIITAIFGFGNVSNAYLQMGVRQYHLVRFGRDLVLLPVRLNDGRVRVRL